ncbi:PAS domain S-box-containing protein, partial [Halorubrum aquaticum]
MLQRVVLSLEMVHNSNMLTRVLDSSYFLDDDATHRENNKRKSDWYRTLVEEVNDLATVVDTDGTITYVSPAITRILGYDPGELVGHEGFEFVHPEDRERNADALEAV